MPGWDQGCKEIARKLAAQGYAAIMPNLQTTHGPRHRGRDVYPRA